MLVIRFWSLLSFSMVNHVFSCFSITCRSKGCFLISFLTINLSLNSMITEVGKLILFPFKVTRTSFHFISNTSQIQFFFSLIHSGVSLPLILNKCMLPTNLQRFTGTYDCVSDMNSITSWILENRHPLNKLHFLTLLVTMNTMPNKINSNIANVYQCILQVQYTLYLQMFARKEVS